MGNQLLLTCNSLGTVGNRASLFQCRDLVNTFTREKDKERFLE